MSTIESPLLGIAIQQRDAHERRLVAQKEADQGFGRIYYNIARFFDDNPSTEVFHRINALDLAFGFITHPFISRFFRALTHLDRNPSFKDMNAHHVLKGLVSPDNGDPLNVEISSSLLHPAKYGGRIYVGIDNLPFTLSMKPTLSQIVSVNQPGMISSDLPESRRATLDDLAQWKPIIEEVIGARIP